MNQKQQKIANELNTNHGDGDDDNDTKDDANDEVTLDEVKKLGGDATSGLTKLTMKQKTILQEFKTGDKERGHSMLKKYTASKNVKEWMSSVAIKYINSRELTKSQLESPPAPDDKSSNSSQEHSPEPKPADDKEHAPEADPPEVTNILDKTRTMMEKSGVKNIDKIMTSVERVDVKEKRLLLLEEIEDLLGIANDEKQDKATQDEAWKRLNHLFDLLTAAYEKSGRVLVGFKKGDFTHDLKDKTGEKMENIEEEMKKKITYKEMETISPDEAKAAAEKEKKDKKSNTIKTQPYKVTLSPNAKTTFSYDINDIFSIIEKDLKITLSDRAKTEIDALIKRVVKNIHGSSSHGSERVNKTIEKIEDYINSKSDGDTTFSFSGSDRDQLVAILQREITPVPTPKKKHGFDIMGRIDALRNFV